MAGVDVLSAWQFVIHNICNIEQSREDATNDERMNAAVDILKIHHQESMIEDRFWDELQRDLRERVSPMFWSHLTKDLLLEPTNIVPTFSHAVNELHSILTHHLACCDKLEWVRTYVNPSKKYCKSGQFLMQRYFKAILFFIPPAHFHDIVYQFYSKAFKVFHTSAHSNDEVELETIKCDGCSLELDSCQCSDIMKTFHVVNRQLNEVGVLERVSGESVTAIIHQRIKHHIEQTCQGNFEVSYLDNLEKWLNTVVLNWLSLVYTQEGASISAFKDRLFHYMYQTYAQVRISELFNIIVEYPESEPALNDLKTCMISIEKNNLRTKLVSSLKNALETRLLHPGVNTSDILTAYISAIRALRLLDPSGVILELVCEPVRKYLRSRDDTVRSVVASLTEDGSSELSEELCKGQSLVLEDTLDSEDEDETDWRAWTPDPVDADTDACRGSRSRRTSDIISMLVNIYGSKELFVNEYRTLLADRLLTQYDYNTQREIRYLELLKLRFGESSLHYCEVMLKDVADSKRINSLIAEKNEKTEDGDEEVAEKKDAIAVSGMLLSAQFWPPFREEKVELPEVMQASLQKYKDAYEELKGNRTLTWRPHLGLMNIEIELKGGKILDLSVSPVHAAIIMQFQEKNKWTIDGLSSALHMPSSSLRRKITYWQGQGLLREDSTDTFILVEEQKGKSLDVLVEEDDMESAMASSHDQREEELQVFWSYIVGMLTNLESLPLERIHSMLKMFAMQGPCSTECSLQELKSFLDRKVKDQKLMYNSGVYRLPKPGN